LAHPDAEKRAQALLEQGAGLYEQGKLYEALSCWKQVIQIDPQNEIAAEYLRFIEDNFQIGVDAFLEHHDREPDSLAARSIEIRDSLAPGDSYQDLDWTEILDDGPDRNLKSATACPVPEGVSQDHGDDDFFGELMEPAAPAPARLSEAAWGANEALNDSGVVVSGPAPQSTLLPEFDPLSLPTSRFAAPYRPPASADLPSSPSEGHGSAARRRRASVSESIGGKTERRRSASLRGGAMDERPSASGERRAGRDLADMADDSIQRVLDEEFPGLEDSSVRGLSTPARMDAGAIAQDAVDSLEALLSRGLGELPSGGRSPRPAAPTRTGRPTDSTPGGRTPDGADRSNLESLVRAGLADLERGSGPPARPPTPPPAAPRPAPNSASPSIPPGGAEPMFSAAPPGADLDELMVQSRRRQSLGDFTGSLQLVEQVLSANPEHAEARRYLAENTARLLEMYRSRIGKRTACPRLRLRPQEIIWQSMDHRAGFIVSQVDGQTTYEDIIEISGLPELEATRILARLVDQGVIG